MLLRAAAKAEQGVCHLMKVEAKTFWVILEWEIDLDKR